MRKVVAPCGRQDGSVLVWALFFVALTTGILVSHSFEMSANRRAMDTRYRRVDLANTIAESGLTDATAYLRRQPVQPVVSFAPQLDLTADPPVNETSDPSLGLVREFEVHGNLWGRYEVRNDDAIDVSANYGEPPGTVWDVGARGYLYEVQDGSKAFDQAPNRVISTQAVRTEVRGMSLNLPTTSAIVVDDPSQVQMLGNAGVDGAGGPAVAYKKPLIPILPILDTTIVGLPTSVPILGLDLSVPSIFGMREDKLRSLADIVMFSPRQLQGRVINDQSVYIPGSLQLDPGGLSLRGRMLLAINGDFVASQGNNSDFSGVVYVKGDAVFEGPFTFSGTIIIGGQFKIGGSSDSVTIKADPTTVTALQSALSQYRISREKRPTASTGAFAVPSDLLNTLR
jgi:hypothetical protein